MVSAHPPTPTVWANRLNHLLDAVCGSDTSQRFPVDVAALAGEIPNQFKTNEPIVVQGGQLEAGFEGCLMPFEKNGDTRKHWALIYNEAIASPGRIRFTQAHELGHYLLHRNASESFNCSEADMLDWSHPERVRENEADTFASYLLMPRPHFVRQLTGQSIDLEVLGKCAEVFGVSLLAATLKWLEFSTERAVLVVSRDGTIQWARGSDKGKWLSIKLNKRIHNGQKARLPAQSATMQASERIERTGTMLNASIWFADEPANMPIREMTIRSDQHRYTMTLLVLPDEIKPWERNRDPRRDDEDTGLEDTLSRFERNGQPLQR
jgi:Zn-dependent peptidase ImmA (M78 family)